MTFTLPKHRVPCYVLDSFNHAPQ